VRRFFAGIACLYGDDKSCSDAENRYPNWGAGIQYIIKPKEGIVASLEYAEKIWNVKAVKRAQVCLSTFDGTVGYFLCM
jgi:hypothetical protein